MTVSEKKIGTYLRANGVDCALRGYRYLTLAIAFTVEHPDATGKMYSEYISNSCNVSTKQVEGSIYYALRNKRVTPKKFIHEAASKLRS